MEHTFEEVSQIAHALPKSQRILLADSLWQSVADGPNELSEAAWEAEIGRRVAEVNSGQALTCSLDELEADLRSIVDA